MDHTAPIAMHAQRVFTVCAAICAAAGCIAAPDEERADHEDIGETRQAVDYNGHDYLFVTMPATWSDAKQFCEDIGYGLVTINNAAEEQFLQNYEAKQPWWIGYNDEVAEGTWVWSDGLSAYVNWIPGEPNNAGGENCATDNSTDGKWNDLSCDNSLPFICETTPHIAYFQYSASLTGSASTNTVDRAVDLQADEILTVGTCGIPGTYASGDTFLRLYDPFGVEVASNDDALCDGLSSNLSYMAPANGTYVIRAGCYDDLECGGRVGYTH